MKEKKEEVVGLLKVYVDLPVTRMVSEALNAGGNC